MLGGAKAGTEARRSVETPHEHEGTVYFKFQPNPLQMSPRLFLNPFGPRHAAEMAAHFSLNGLPLAQGPNWVGTSAGSRGSRAGASATTREDVTTRLRTIASLFTVLAPVVLRKWPHISR